MRCGFDVRTVELNMRRRWSGLPQGPSRSNFLKRMGAVMQCLGCRADNKMLLMDVLRDDTMKVPCHRAPNLHVFVMQTHCTATGVQTRQNADHSFAGYANRQALGGARCSPQSLGERSREAPQQKGRQTERSSSEDHCLDEGGREAPQQTGGSCRTSSRRKPAAGTLNRLSRCSKALALADWGVRP